MCQFLVEPHLAVALVEDMGRGKVEGKGRG